MHGVVGVVDDPGLGQDDSRNRRPLLRQLLQGLGQHGCDVLDHRLGAVSGVVDELAAARDDLSGQVRDGQEQRGTTDLQADAGRCAWSRAQARARSADVARQVRLLLDEQPPGAQLGHEGRDRRLGQPRFARQARARQSGTRLEVPQDEGHVRDAHVGVGLGPVRARAPEGSPEVRSVRRDPSCSRHGSLLLHRCPVGPADRGRAPQRSDSR